MYADDATITDGSPINRYLAIPVPDSLAGRENVMGAFTTLLDGWRYGAEGESALSQWHENNQAFWTLAAIDMEAVEIMKVAIVYDEKSQGTNGGTFTAGAWRQRDLNTKLDSSNIVSLATNAVTILESGNYLIRAGAPAFNVAHHQCRLTKNGSHLQQGTSEYINGQSVMSRSLVVWAGALSAGDILRLEHYCETSFATYGFGTGDGSNFGVEVYSIMEVIQF